MVSQQIFPLMSVCVSIHYHVQFSVVLGQGLQLHLFSDVQTYFMMRTICPPFGPWECFRNVRRILSELCKTPVTDKRLLEVFSVLFPLSLSYMTVTWSSISTAINVDCFSCTSWWKFFWIIRFHVLFHEKSVSGLFWSFHVGRCLDFFFCSFDHLFYILYY